ncbi:hypothetical protein QBC47DRAFT_419183 [Echria macrotheca]|uniref:Glutathione S-transferase n=1 Tax=Echria macrotheca TaxID=438768 RepID=A0AAJ0BN62_9PEZI|nr:hypothetical protein QBC47DRAFT_419183 [Echria macrotheca]
MAPFGTFYTYPQNFRVQRAKAVAALNGLEVVEDPNFKFRETNASPEYLAKFPLGKVPGFETADGFCLAESAAIARFLAASGPKAAQLLGADVKTAAKIDEWVFFEEAELVGNLIPLLLMAVLGLRPFDQGLYDMHVANFERALRRVEVGLEGGRRFLVGDKVTLADVMVGGALFFAGKFLMDSEMRGTVAPSVEGYLRGLLEVPEVGGAFGELVLCEARKKPE